MMEVYKAISAVTAALAKAGIAKDRKNTQQGFMFRGIDDVYDALAPAMVAAGLVFLPRYLERKTSERESKSGGVLFSVVVEAEFDLIAVTDGSKHTIRTYGEAMDSADKATNKAMSAAYKYAAFQAFAIPVEVHDADASTPSVGKKRDVPPPVVTPPAPPAAPLPEDGANAHLTALKAKVWAQARAVGLKNEDLKEWSTHNLQKSSSKEWDVDDCEAVLEFIYSRVKTVEG